MRSLTNAELSFSDQSDGRCKRLDSSHACDAANHLLLEEGIIFMFTLKRLRKFTAIVSFIVL